LAYNTVRIRFATSLAANIARSGVGYISGMLVARWLGPASYGDMSFLLATFLAVRKLVDMGSSGAFFTYLSQRPRSKRFVMSFFAWLTAQFLIPLFVIGALFPSQWIQTIWHSENRGLVLLAFTASFMMNSIWPIVQQSGESQRQTAFVQGVGTAVAVAHLLAVVLLWWLGFMGLYAIFIAIALEYLLAAVVVHNKFAYAAPSEADLIDDSPKLLFGKYMSYCLPLVPYSIVGFAYAFADRWLLQHYGGGVEQAYYSVGAQFANVALIATSSLLTIFWKEIAEAHHRGDNARIGMLYKKVSRVLFLTGAVIAGFLIPWAEDLLRLILGAAYAGGATTLAIMFLFPAHQSMGRVGGAMIYATGRVSMQVVPGIFSMIISIGLTYLALAPRSAPVPGLGLASEGLALKMVLMNLVQVNIVAYVISRVWKWPFDWVYQPVSLIGCVGLGWVVHFAATGLAGHALPLLVVMGVGGVLYLMAVAVFVYAMPWLAGLTQEELALDVDRALRKAMSGFKPQKSG
jgi:O-antigen/teichoic acid export membrane protein